MPSSMMYYEENYVVLPPDLQERFVNQAELEELLEELLTSMQDALPVDLQNIPNIKEQVQRLIKTACDIDCGDRGRWQWYVVRLEK